jgi:hypothetical protein
MSSASKKVCILCKRINKKEKIKCGKKKRKKRGLKEPARTTCFPPSPI